MGRVEGGEFGEFIVKEAYFFEKDLLEYGAEMWEVRLNRHPVKCIVLWIISSFLAICVTELPHL